MATRRTTSQDGRPSPGRLSCVCAVCDAGFPNSTEHMVHVIEEHPDLIGRGRTATRPWSCWRCARDVPPDEMTCPACGFTRPGFIRP